MKKVSKILGFIALVAIMVFTFAACEEDGGGDHNPNPGGNNSGGGGSGSGDSGTTMGATLSITNEQIWHFNGESNTLYNGSPAIISAIGIDENNRQVSIGGSGNITNGRLTFSIGTPSVLKSIASETIFTYGNYGLSNINIQINPSEAQSMSLDFISTNADSGHGVLGKVRYPSMTNAIISMETVNYIYVDRDVTISSPGGAFDENVSYAAFNMTLRQGWNAITMNITGTQQSGNTTFSLGDSSSANWTNLEIW